MSDAEKSKSNDVTESKAEEIKSKIADELESEMERRDEGRLESERAEMEDLNQGMGTGTHDSTRHGVNWGPSYGSAGKAKAAKASPGSEEQKKDSDS